MSIIKVSSDLRDWYVIGDSSISVQCLIVEIRKGISPSELAKKYELTLGEVAVALSFYVRNQSEIDREIAPTEEFAKLREQNI